MTKRRTLAQIKAAAKRVDRSERGSDEEYLRETMAYMPSRLTLEDVERACEAVFKALPSTTDPSHFAAIRAYWLDVMDRLRQQVNGDTCNRGEG